MPLARYVAETRGKDLQFPPGKLLQPAMAAVPYKDMLVMGQHAQGFKQAVAAAAQAAVVNVALKGGALKGLDGMGKQVLLLGGGLCLEVLARQQGGLPAAQAMADDQL